MKFLLLLSILIYTSGCMRVVTVLLVYDVACVLDDTFSTKIQPTPSVPLITVGVNRKIYKTTDKENVL